jgi:hypothetical protein
MEPNTVLIATTLIAMHRSKIPGTHAFPMRPIHRTDAYTDIPVLRNAQQVRIILHIVIPMVVDIQYLATMSKCFAQGGVSIRVQLPYQDRNLPSGDTVLQPGKHQSHGSGLRC